MLWAGKGEGRRKYIISIAVKTAKGNMRRCTQVQERERGRERERERKRAQNRAAIAGVNILE
jgi:hypothetical protein